MSSGNNPPRRIKELVRERARSACEWCGTYLPAGNFHHRLNKGMGGTSDPDIHSPANLVYLCGMGNASGCHGKVHQVPDFARALGLSISGFNPHAPKAVPARLWDGLFYLNPDGTRTAAVITKEDQ